MAQESERSTGSEGSPGKPRSSAEGGLPSDDWTARYDSNLRFAIDLIERGGWDQLAARTGIVWKADTPQFMSVFIELIREEAVDPRTKKLDIAFLNKLEL